MQLTELEVWRMAMDLAKTVYLATGNFTEMEPNDLGYQLRRTVTSIPSNIAAAASRKHGPEPLRYLTKAKDHIYEAETLLYLAEKLSFMSEEELHSILEQLESSRRLLFGFMKYYKRSIQPNEGFQQQ